jgi:hypothetical protein
MSTPPMPLRAAHKPVSLAKLATVFALTFSLAFGLCSVSGISISGGGNYQVAQLLIGTSLAIEAVCAAGLLAIAVIAIIRKRRSGEQYRPR